MKRCVGTLAACVAGVSILVAAPAAFAQADEQGFYLGGAYGQTKIKGACGDLRSELIAIGATVGACDDADSGFKLFGGYRFNRHFALEASYLDFGSLTMSATRLGTTANVTAD